MIEPFWGVRRCPIPLASSALLATNSPRLNTVATDLAHRRARRAISGAGFASLQSDENPICSAGSGPCRWQLPVAPMTCRMACQMTSAAPWGFASNRGRGFGIVTGPAL
jgi:hypothetical protein